MLKLLTVCTGNICRSPLAAILLKHRISDIELDVASAGTRARADAAMTAEARETGIELGATVEDLSNHRSRRLTYAQLVDVDLTLAMAREHRREVVELVPAQTRRCFTIREFSRLVADMTDGELITAAAASDVDTRSRFASALSAVSARRGIVPPPSTPMADDVVDPYRQPQAIYEQAARELQPALLAVERVIRLVAD